MKENELLNLLLIVSTALACPFLLPLVVKDAEP